MKKEIVNKFLELPLELDFDGYEATINKLIIETIEFQNKYYTVSYNIKIDAVRYTKNFDESEQEVECDYTVFVSDLMIENENKNLAFKNITNEVIAESIQKQLNR